MRKRSSYRPRPVNVLAHVQTIVNLAGMNVDTQIECVWALNEVYERVAQARASQEDWRSLLDCANILEQLVRWRQVQDLHGAVPAAIEVFKLAIARVNDTGKRTLYASELQAIRAMTNLWDREMPRVPRGTAAQAAARVKVLTEQALAGNAPKCVQVIEPPRAA